MISKFKFFGLIFVGDELRWRLLRLQLFGSQALMLRTKGGIKAKGTLVPHWKRKEINIWLNKIGPKIPLGVSPFGSNWVPSLLA